MYKDFSTISTLVTPLPSPILLFSLLPNRAQRKLQAYPLIYLSEMANNTLEFAKTQLEWMSDEVERRFENLRDNPFDCRQVIHHTVPS